MEKRKDISPPRWAVRLLSWYCRPELLEDLEGDLHEYFQRNASTRGARKAKLIYILDVFKFFRLYTVRKPELLNLFIHWIMIRSYVKTSGRNIVRNPLFSGINIVGLAISMSVGLLLLAILADLFSYDKFHEHYNNIYRVTTTHVYRDHSGRQLATTSVKAGKMFRENISGVDAVTILRPRFSGDAQVHDKKIPLQGTWADQQFFTVFTFPLKKGNAATALKDPYSIVLTEETAKKIFGDERAFGRTLKIGDDEYTVTGIAAEVPVFSHLQFSALVSFSTLELKQQSNEDFLDWNAVWETYVYARIPAPHPGGVQASLAKICIRENANLQDEKIFLTLQPMSTFVVGPDLSNNNGPIIPPAALWVLGALAGIVVLSACFNYTNLSIARSLKRSREVGIRKVVGASRSQVVGQFIAEAVIIALFSLGLSFVLFLLLRSQLMALAPELSSIVSLQLSPRLILYFIGLAAVVGFLAGVLPALFYARVNAIQALKNVALLKVFRHVNLRKGLIVVQYTFSIMFMAAAVILNTQHKHFMSLDLGFKTENVINISLQGNNPDHLLKALHEIPEVMQASKSLMITTTGNMYGATIKYGADSLNIFFNSIDEHYIPLHGHALVAGRNLQATTKENAREILVNEQVLKRLNIAGQDPEKAIGEVITMDNKELTIVGVLRNFHYNNPKNGTKDDPVVFLYANDVGFVNVKIASLDLPATLERIEAAWKKIDDVHPFQASFYDDDIQRAYNDIAAMVKVIGFLSFLAVTIASMGLFGMVVFTTDARLKEVSIRKVMGASQWTLLVLLSRGFLLLLVVAASIALPGMYLFFQQVVFSIVPSHAPINVAELLSGLLVIVVIAFLMIGSQTWRAARSNPAEVLKNE